MQRRFVKVGVAAVVLVVVASGSYEVALAGPGPSVVSQSASIGACATGSGYLRLVDSKAHCATGYTTIKVAQAATTAKDGSIAITQDTGTGKTIITPAGDKVYAYCDSDDESNGAQAGVTIDPAGSGLGVAGTFLADAGGDGDTKIHDRHDGSVRFVPAGPSLENDGYTGSGADFIAETGDDDSATAQLAVHLLASGAGRFGVDASIYAYASGCDIDLQVTPSN